MVLRVRFGWASGCWWRFGRNTGVLRCAQNDDVKQTTAKATVTTRANATATTRANATATATTRATATATTRATATATTRATATATMRANTNATAKATAPKVTAMMKTKLGWLSELHGFGVPLDDCALFEAKVAQECGTCGSKAEGGIFDGLFARADGGEEVAEVVVVV